MTDALVVLARAPRPGTGKTRLRAALAGCDPALVDRLAAAMVEDTLAWAGRGRLQVVAGQGDPWRLRRLAPAAVHVEQPDAPFGERIEHAVAAGLMAAGRGGRVVQVGTDSPTLPAAVVDEAFAALRRRDDAVIVPAVDGGWVALGVTTPLDVALARAAIRWSTADAAADTIAALRAAGRRVRVLAPWFDVDEPDGLRRLGRDRAAAVRAPRSVAAARAIAASPAVAATPGAMGEGRPASARRPCRGGLAPLWP